MNAYHRALLTTHAAALCLIAACGTAPTETAPPPPCPERPAGCASCGDVYAGANGALPDDICYQNPGPPERCQPWGLLEACGRAACWGAADCGQGATFEAPRLPACTACLERACSAEVEMCEVAP